MLLPDDHEVVLLDGEEGGVVFADEGEQQFWQVVDHVTRLLF